MGNTQSTTDGQRIAKPQSIGNLRAAKSSTPASQSDSLLSPSSHLEESRTSKSPSLIPSPTIDGRSDEEVQHLERLQSPPLGQKEDRGGLRHSQVDLLAANVARSLSRSGSRGKNIVSARSSMARMQQGSQLSVASDSAVDLDSALAIIHELRKTASPEDLAALHKALLPAASRDSLAPSVTAESPDELDPATAALIRRKSFAQPGVATRHAKPDRNVLRKSVPVPSSRPKPWTKDMMGASPLARLSSLDVPQVQDLEPPPEVFENRAHTPSDLDYSQLGNLKHGSLMVVNGPPSPNPSVATPGNVRRTASDEHDEAFFTASEHSDSRPGSRRTLDVAEENCTWREQHARDDEHFRGRGQVLDYAPPRRDGSPLKQELRQASPEMTRDADAESVYSRHVRPVRSMASLHSHRTRRFSFEESSGDEVRPPVTNLQSQSAICLADEYMSEMPPSPYKKPVVQRDESPVSPLEESDDEVRAPSIREQSVVLPPPSIAQDVPPISPRKPLRSNPTLEDVPMPTNMKPRRPIGLKTDSGYSSASTSVVDSMSPIKMHQSNLSTVESLAERPQQKRFYSSRGTADLAVRIGQIGSKQNTPDPDAEPGIIESIEKDEPRDEKMKRSKSWRKSVRRSLPRLLSTESTLTTASKATSASATSSNERKTNKLRKRRPLSQPPISVGDRHVLDRSIPRVPSSVFSRYSGRLSASPGMQHLEQTYEHDVDSRDGSAETTASKTSLPSCFFPDAGLEDGPAPPAYRLSFKRGSFRRSRTQIDEAEILSTGIADFGTVSQSLGTSPYDIAHMGPRRSISGGATQPHHLSTKTVRSGPREGWDAETASRIAQTRSRERAAQQYAWEQQRHTERNSMPPRAMSYHEDMPMAPAYRPQNAPVQRPKSMHAQHVPSAPGNFNRVPNRKPVASLPVLPPHQPRPRTSYQERDPSPVKKLVNAFEQRASEAPAPPPMPSTQPDWSDSSRIWRERRINAQTGAQTASPPQTQSRTMTTTTTTTTTTSSFASRDPRTTTTTTMTVGATRPPLQNRKSMPQMRQGQPTAPAPYAGAPNYDRYSGSHTQYTGGNRFTQVMRKRDITPTSSAARRLYGVDFGDVPVRVL